METHINLSGEISGSIGNGILPHLLNIAKKNQSNNALERLFFKKIITKGATARKEYKSINGPEEIFFCVAYILMRMIPIMSIFFTRQSLENFISENQIDDIVSGLWLTLLPYRICTDTAPLFQSHISLL